MTDRASIKQRRDTCEADLRNYSGIEYSRREGSPLVSDFRALHQYAWNVGNCSLLLGDVRAAREAYAECGLYLLELLREIRRRWTDLKKSRRFSAGTYIRWGFYTTILSAHKGLIETAATNIREISADFAQEYTAKSSVAYLQTCVLASYLQNDIDEAKDYLYQYIGQDETLMTELLTELHETMIDDDEAATTVALQEVATKHDDIFKNARSWKADFSHTAAAHLLAARYRGMNIRVSDFTSDAVPLAFDDYDVGDDIDLPSPEYVDNELIP